MYSKIKTIIKSNNFIYKNIIIIINIFNKIKFLLKNWKYSNKKYWEKRWKDFINEDYQKWIYDQHFWILEKIKTYKPKKILEIWCWFWRNIKFIKDNIDYEIDIIWIDISNTLIKQAKSYLHWYDNITLYESDILSLDKNINYDLILIHWVFMHISKDDFRKNRDYLNSLNFNYLLEVEEIKLEKVWKIKNENINWFTFSHNYLNMNENIKKFIIKNNLICLDIKK